LAEDVHDRPARLSWKEIEVVYEDGRAPVSGEIAEKITAFAAISQLVSKFEPAASGSALRC
jgi:hypothetical protein